MASIDTRKNMIASPAKPALLGGAPIRCTPFPKWPQYFPGDEEAVLGVLRSEAWWRPYFGQGRELGEVGSEVYSLQQEFSAAHHAGFGIATNSGTAALDACVRSLNLEIGSEIIVPAYSYVATASCVLQSNLVPVFVDIDSRTYNIDPERVDAAITERTRAIIPVHFAGQIADMDAVMQTAARHDLTVIEDCAHAHGSEWRGRRAGSIGHAGVFSFQGSKNLTAGEGGLIITSDEAAAATIESLIWGGREVGRPWYEVHRLGWNARMTEFQAALLRVQMKRLEAQNARRQAMASCLTKLLSEFDGIRTLEVDPRATLSSNHLYILRYDAELFGLPRSVFLKAIQAEGVPAFSGYEHALYKNPLFSEKKFMSNSFPLNTAYCEDRDYHDFAALCPAAEHACAAEAIWLTHNILLGDEKDMQDIADAVAKIWASRSELAGIN